MTSTLAAPTIRIRLEDRGLDLAAGTTLAQLVEQLGHAPDAVSTAVDGQFVARAQRAQRVLQSGETVLFFRPIVGG